METKFITTLNDIRVAYFEKYNKKSKIGIVFVHGLGEHKGRYEDFINQIYKNDISVFAVDIRGHGESGGKRGYVKGFDDFISDLDHIILHIKSKYPNLAIALMGHSLGGLIVTGYAETKNNANFLILSNPLLSYPLLTLLFHFVPYKMLGSVKIKKTKSESAEMLKYSYNDPLACNYFTLRLLGSIFNKGISFVYKRLEKVKIPVLLLGGELDPVLNSKRLYKIVSQFGSDDKELKIYKETKHRLLQSSKKKEVICDITDWLKTRINCL